ncbi:queuine tRNA-ribosyltransferase accessory subunit 2 [Artemisia annua]|uniref:Queuine tRNA-ribosyltransferase accessory subunit 2 n=1 Tax=Artemisia annua TaxID=35608 RepID=A0A2U1MKJ6_ARTAN|nr:queuine tRNA-ribosyltransferase accessory subunit 2 [Artemisia annua]
MPPANLTKQNKKMKFCIKSWSKNSRARVGLLQLTSFRQPSENNKKEIEVETPALVLTTRKGLPAFIPPDHLLALQFCGSTLLQFSPMHLTSSSCKVYPRVGVGCVYILPPAQAGLADCVSIFIPFTLKHKSDANSVSGVPNSVSCSMEGPNLKTISSIGGIHQLLGLKDYGFVSVPRDSILSLPESSSSNKHGASFETPCGRFLVKPVEYMKMISSMKPDLWVSLADEVPASATVKRNRASVERTIKWLDDCISLNTVNKLSFQYCGVRTQDIIIHLPTDGALFGSIVGGCSIEEREHCAQEVAKRNVAGYYIGGFGLGDSIDERAALLHAVTFIQKNIPRHLTKDLFQNCLPNEKPRQICGLGLPGSVWSHNVIFRPSMDGLYITQVMKQGSHLIYKPNTMLIFLFHVSFFNPNSFLHQSRGGHRHFVFLAVLLSTDSYYDDFDRYIYQLTLGGFALIFPLDGKFNHVSDPKLSAMGGDGTKINLKATVYRKDASRIVDGCNCYTCQNHTKAYINHLLNVHEMLAPILLEIHNTHHYLSFFRLIREAIKEGKFEELRQKFIESRRDHLLAASLSDLELEASIKPSSCPYVSKYNDKFNPSSINLLKSRHQIVSFDFGKFDKVWVSRSQSVVVVRATGKKSNSSSSSSGNGDHSVPEGDGPKGNNPAESNKSSDTGTPKSQHKPTDWREFRAILYLNRQLVQKLRYHEHLVQLQGEYLKGPKRKEASVVEMYRQYDGHKDAEV